MTINMDAGIVLKTLRPLQHCILVQLIEPSDRLNMKDHPAFLMANLKAQN